MTTEELIHLRSKGMPSPVKVTMRFKNEAWYTEVIQDRGKRLVMGTGTCPSLNESIQESFDRAVANGYGAHGHEV